MNRSKTNPARRLCAILEKGVTISNSNGSVPQSLVAMSQLFEVEQDDLVAMYDKQSSLFKLLSRTEALLRSIDHPQSSSFQTCIPGIQAAIRSINLNEGQQWTLSLNHNRPSKSDIELLRLSADALDNIQPELALEEEELSNLREEAKILLDQAEDANISPLMKAIVIESLDNIITSINDYDVSGASGLKSSLSESYGRIVVDRDIILPEKDKEWVKKYWEYITKFTTAVNATEIGHKIGTSIANLMDKMG